MRSSLLPLYSITITITLAPGSSGMLDLNIIPKVDTALDVKLSLNIVAFAEVEKKDGNGEVIYKMDGNTYAVDDNGNKIPETEIIEITDAESFASAVTNNRSVCRALQ